LDKKTIPDDTIRLPKVIEVIDFILKKGE
jgi:hypothetical protein